MSKKLILLDAYALIYRAHFAFIKNPRINSKGLNTSAIFGFCNSLLEVTNKFDPSHIGVVFDPPGGSDREGVFADYKANRQEMPEDIRKAIPYIFDLLKAMNIKVISNFFFIFVFYSSLSFFLYLQKMFHHKIFLFLPSFSNQILLKHLLLVLAQSFLILLELIH